MQMQSAVVSTGRRKKSESPGQSREDLNSPLLPHQHTTSPCLPPPSRILTDSSAPASAPSELSSLQCLFLLPIIQSDSVLPSHPLSFRFSSPYHSVQTSSNLTRKSVHPPCPLSTPPCSSRASPPRRPP